jgi:hypothetical protein
MEKFVDRIGQDPSPSSGNHRSSDIPLVVNRKPSRQYFVPWVKPTETGSYGNPTDDQHHRVQATMNEDETLRD